MARNLSVIATVFSAFLIMVGSGAIMALLPKRVLELSGSIANVGYLASAYAVFSMLLQIPVGNLADRFGFKPFLVTGYFVCAATGFLYFYSEAPLLLFVGRMLQGIGEVPVWALAPAVLAIQFPLSKGKVLGIYNASIHFGLTAGSLVAVLTRQCWIGNQVFLLFGWLGLAGGLLMVVFMRSPREPGGITRMQFNIRDAAQVCLNRQIGCVLAGVGLYGAGYGIFITIIPAFLILQADGARFGAGTVLTLFFITLSLAQLAAGPLCDRKGYRAVMCCGMACASVGMGALFFLKPPWLYFPLSLGGLGLGIFCVAAMAFLHAKFIDALKGTISGTIYFAWGAGYFGGPLLLGKAAQWIPLQTGFITLAGTFLLECVALLSMVAPRKVESTMQREAYNA